MMRRLSPAQQRLLDLIRSYHANGGAEYWPTVNDWVKGDTKRPFPLALLNINRTVDALIRSGEVRLDDDGFLIPRVDAKGGHS